MSRNVAKQENTFAKSVAKSRDVNFLDGEMSLSFAKAMAKFR